MNNKSDFAKTIGFGVLEIGFIVAVIVGIVYLIKYIIKKTKKNKTQEPFTEATNTIINTIDIQYGNIIYNKGLSDVKNNTKVVLPGRFRITGIKVNTASNNNSKNNNSYKNDVSSKYKVYIADNEDDITKPDVRKLVSCGNNSGSILDINTLYNNPSNFEKEGKGMFVGQVLLITTDDSNSDIKDIKPLPSTLEIMVLGLDPFAINFQDYDKFMKVDPKPNTKGSKDVKVGYLQLFNIGQSSSEYRIKYSNTIDNNSNKYAIDGPNRLTFEVNKEYPFIFFNKPIIANNLYIYNGDTKIEQYILYGSESISKRDRANFKLQQQSFDDKHMIVEGEKCPNVGEMINKQLQAQQICEALEYKDKARNKKLAYEKDKIYLGKLAQQDKEIEELENIVKGLIEKKNTRIENNQGSNIDEVEKEMRRVEKVREEAEMYLKSSRSIPADLKVKVNIDPEFDYIRENTTLN